jgi:RNase P subunit RPR2
MGSLKDALLKAGVTTAKTPNLRVKIDKKEKTKTISHQEQRNFCEVCDQVQPDVELYRHRNPTTEAEWICVRCADQLQIADSFRRTAQSDTSIRKMFRREYGATASPLDFKKPLNDRPQDPKNGNR